MTKVSFFKRDGRTVGYLITDHTADDCSTEGKTVCAAVSSAAYLAANTITDVIGDTAQIDVRDGYMKVTVPEPTQSTLDILDGLNLHLTQLSNQYKQYISLNTEVQLDAEH